MNRSIPLFVIALCLPFLVSSCAWSNPDNRPVWNAFEAHAVPDDSTWFALSLPIIAPLGLLAVTVDTFIAHPIQIVDDAVGDAGDCWSDLGPKFDDQYYTQTAYLPVRAGVQTPGTFLLSFLGRSLFDLPRRGAEDKAGKEDSDKGDVDEVLDEATLRKNRHEAILAWYDAVLEDHEAEFPSAYSVFEAWDHEVLAPVDATLRRASVLSRMSIYSVGLLYGVQKIYEAGLADRDPGLRFMVIKNLPSQYDVREDLLRSLREDSVESIRELARQR